MSSESKPVKKFDLKPLLKVLNLKDGEIQLSKDDLFDILFYCPFNLKHNLSKIDQKKEQFQNTDEKITLKLFGDEPDYKKSIRLIKLRKLKANE